MIALAHHLLGDQAQALMYADRILPRNPSIGRDARYCKFKFDDRASALGIAARGRWIQGFPDQAIDLAYEGIERATTLNNERAPILSPEMIKIFKASKSSTMIRGSTFAKTTRLVLLDGEESLAT